MQFTVNVWGLIAGSIPRTEEIKQVVKKEYPAIPPLNSSLCFDGKKYRVRGIEFYEFYETNDVEIILDVEKIPDHNEIPS